MTTIRPLDRREFLKTSAAAGVGLILGAYLPGKFQAATVSAAELERFAPNAWIRIAPDNSVTLLIDKSEMGQGVQTSLAMLLAEELDCDWKNITTEFAPAAKEYFNPLFGLQGTGGSTSVRASWGPLTKAGAAAREMLVAAAAETWSVPASKCRTENGSVLHSAPGRKLSYGQLAAKAARLPVPPNPKLKDPQDYKFVGKSIKRLDTRDKVNGRAGFGIDVRLPGMLHAVVARCPVFDGKVASFKSGKAEKIPGVRKIVPVSTGIAVIADNTWTAIKGRDALEITWDEGPNADNSSDAIQKLFAKSGEKPGAIARKEGNFEAGMAAAAKKLEAVYEVPFLAHATMEPMNCTADVRPDGCDIHAPTQFQTFAQMTAAKITGLPPEKIRIHTTYLGGGFGRRAEQDFIAEAVEASKAAGAPVQVTWTREDDMQHDFYRPAARSRLAVGLDADGWPVAWSDRIVSPSIVSRFFPGAVKNGLDNSSFEAAADTPYAIPNILVDYVLQEAGVPVGFWRSVGNSQNGYVRECFTDEMARAGGKDPVEFRRRLLKNSPRSLAVLNLVAEKSGWGTPLPAGRTRGVAVVESFASHVAQVAEVSVNRKAGTVQVHRVVCVIDCGKVVNPEIVRAQMESAIIYGLTAALKGAITISRGRVEQSNFHDYEMVRMDETPRMEIHVVPSTEAPGGAGEPGTPPIAPAVCNAIFAATGKPIRRLPIRSEDLA